MAAPPGRKKPPTPPKPAIIKERCVGSVRAKGESKNENIAFGIKTDGAANCSGEDDGENTRCVNLVKSNTGQVLPKPPLLPKPQTSKSVTTSKKCHIPHSRPYNTQLLIAADENFDRMCSLQDEVRQTDSFCQFNDPANIRYAESSLKIKVPVAKLEEFETLSETFKDGIPVMFPPQSPKCETFKREDLLVLKKDSELLSNKELCSHQENSCDPFSSACFETMTHDWQNTDEKSSSLGRPSAFKLVGNKSKRTILERNRKPDGQTDEGVAPPSMGRRQSPFPVYGDVSYSLEKNHRQNIDFVKKISEGCFISDEHSSKTEVNKHMVGEGLNLSEANNDELEGGMNCFAQNTEYFTKEEDLNKMVINGRTDICKDGDSDIKYSTSHEILNSGQLFNGCVISEDKTSSVIKVDNDVCVSHQIHTLDSCTEETCNTSLPEVNLRETASSNPLLILTDDNCNATHLQWLSTEVGCNSAFDHIELHSAKSCDGNISSQAVERSNSELSNVIQSNGVNEVVVVSNVTTHYAEKLKANVTVFTSDDLDSSQDITRDAILNEHEVTVHNETCVSQNRKGRFSSSSLPHRRKLEMKETGKFHQRRQSWSSCKDDSVSPDKAVEPPDTHKCKLRSHSWWSDSDSTEPDVSLTSSDAKDCSLPMRSKLASWWGSFGRGNLKHKSGRNSSSQFYCNSQELPNGRNKEKDQNINIAVTNGIHNPIVNVQESEVDAFSSGQDNSRPGSGLSALGGLDADQRSDAPVSEESFEIYPHSESDNESEKISECIKKHAYDESVEKKAFYTAQELMTSEKVFIDALKLLNVDFRLAIDRISSQQKCPVIPDGELCKILNSLPQLQSLNEDLLRDLEHRIECWDSVKKISDVIVRKGPFLKLYTTYIQNFESQCNYLEECCQKYPRFSKAVKEFEASPRCQKLTLKHYMLKPVQRIPQYRLLLEDYLRHLSSSSPDLEDTRTALKIVCDVADHANRSIKLGDHLSKLLQLQSQLGNYEIIKPGRLFLKAGELFKLSRKGMQPRYFILLNDCLLYTSYYGTVQSSGLKVNYELPLNGMKVSLPQAEDYRNEFSIISIKRSFTLSAQSLIERQQWVDALQKAITDFASRQLSFQNVRISSSVRDGNYAEPLKLGQEAPVWIQDLRVTMCQLCTAEFTVTFRRHHCRACGKVVCGDCSDFRAPLQYMRFQSVRVCEDCYNTLFTEARDPGSKLNHSVKCELGNTARITDYFKRLGPVSGKKAKKFIPQRLKEVTANDTGSQMSGWLQRRSRRSWKRFWFVLKEQVLYVYKASEDIVALESIPVLGYTVEPMKQRHLQQYEGVAVKLVFQLAHPGQHPLVFCADSEHLVKRWIAAMNEATILK